MKDNRLIGRLFIIHGLSACPQIKVGLRQMEHDEVDYFLKRHQQAIAAAESAASHAARVAHLEFAFRYSVAAARACPPTAGDLLIDQAQS